MSRRGVPREPLPRPEMPEPQLKRPQPPRNVRAELETRKLELEVQILERQLSEYTPEDKRLRGSPYWFRKADDYDRRLTTILELHPVAPNPGVDGDGYVEDTAPFCPTCNVAAPCPTRLAAIGSTSEVVET